MGTGVDVSLLTRVLGLSDLDGELATLGTSLLSEGGVGVPSGGSSWGTTLLHHSVDLLEG